MGGLVNVSGRVKVPKAFTRTTAHRRVRPPRRIPDVRLSARYGP